MVTVKFPAPSSAFVMNLLGLLGLAGVACAVGGLTHNVWWALLIAAVECIGLSVVAAVNAEESSARSGEEPVALSRAA